MEKITLLAKNLQRSGHVTGTATLSLTIKTGDSFSWNYQTRTITYDPAAQSADQLLMHEFGHAILDHHDFDHDITLLSMERAAWDTARLLSAKFDVVLDNDIIEESLDTYRDWLHMRSICPNCQSTGIQTKERTYLCLACHHTWRANDARTCALRRYHTKKRP